jgi:outer membrane protein assembly factor BamB
VIDNESQSVKWSKSLGIRFSSSPAIGANRLAIGTDDGALTVIDLDTGADVLQRQWRNGITAILVVGPDEFVIGDDRGTVESFNSTSASMWRFKTGASISNISLAGNALAVISLDNFLYLLSADRGKVKWRKRLLGRSLYTPLILPDRIVAATYGENSIPVSDIRNGKTINRIDLDEGSYFTQSPQLTGNGAFMVTMLGSIVLLNDKPCLRQ